MWLPVPYWTRGVLSSEEDKSRLMGASYRDAWEMQP